MFTLLSTCCQFVFHIVVNLLSQYTVLLYRHLYALGKRVWRTCKKRYFVLVQVSQYTFAVCSYKDRKAEPMEMLQLKGFTVDYCEHQAGKISQPPAMTYEKCDFQSLMSCSRHSQGQPAMSYYLFSLWLAVLVT